MTTSRTTRPIPVIDMPDGVTPSYETIVAAGAAGLAPNEWWVIDHDEGTLWDTASKRLDEPVRIICGALDADWSDLTDSGFRLARKTREISDVQ